MQIIKTTDLSYLTEIKNLYTEAFTGGISQQFIENDELEKYLQTILISGYVTIALENEKIIGAILACPITFDKLIPVEIIRKYPVERSVYIAEMMIQEEFQGKGIGKKLILEFLNSVDRVQYSDAFIRVWDKNTPALSLYEKTGFKRIATIKQIKTKADGKEKFVMNKIYLHQKLN